MRFLIVSPVLPSQPDSGAKVRIGSVIRALLEMGHQVGLIAMAFRDEIEEAGNWGTGLSDLVLIPHRRSSEKPLSSGVRRNDFIKRALIMGGRVMTGTPFNVALMYQPGLAEAVDRLEPEYDWIMVELFFMAQSIPEAVFRRARHKLCLVEHDISFVPIRRKYETASGAARLKLRLEYLLYRQCEIRTIRRFENIIAMSDLDRDQIRRIAPGRNVLVVPNGVDAVGRAPSDCDREPGRIELLFLGGLEHGPNFDGLAFFIEKVMPLILKARPEVVLTVVGRTGGREGDLVGSEVEGRVVFEGFVSDLEPFFSRSLAMVVPLRIGGGTRLKILEAMAAGLPVITTSIGAEGLSLEPGRQALFADAPEAFVEAVQRLIREPGLMKKICAEARKLAVQKYDWRVIVENMISDLEQLKEKNSER